MSLMPLQYWNMHIKNLSVLSKIAIKIEVNVICIIIYSVEQ